MRTESVGFADEYRLPLYTSVPYNPRAFNVLCCLSCASSRCPATEMPVRQLLRVNMKVSKPQPLVDVFPAIAQLKWQVVVCGLVSLVALFIGGKLAGLSALSGAGIAVLGQAFFVSRAFRHVGARSAQQIVKNFYRGEAGKFVLTAFLFTTVFIGFKAVLPAWLFASFILEQLVAWIVPMTIRSTQS